MSDNDILTSAELDVIEQRVNAAKEGPWDVETDTCDHEPPCSCPPYLVGISSHDGSLVQCMTDTEASGEDVLFIAHSRTDIPRLIATVRERDQEIASIHREADSFDQADFDAVDRIGNTAMNGDCNPAEIGSLGALIRFARRCRSGNAPRLKPIEEGGK